MNNDLNHKLNTKIKIKIFYFAKIKEILKKSYDNLELDSEIIKTKEIFEHIKILNLNKENSCKLQEDLQNAFVSCLISHNDEYIDIFSEIILKDGDEISIIPPISAG